MGFFSNLEIENYDRQYSDRQLLDRMAEYFRPYKRNLIYTTLLMLLIAFCSAAVPILVSRSLDLIGENVSPQLVLLLSLSVLFLGVIVWGANWGRRRINVRIIGDVVLALRMDAFTAAAEHDLAFYDEIASGKVVSRITSDSNDFGQTVNLIVDLFAQVLQAVILGFVLFSIDWRLTLYILAFMPVIFLAAAGFRKLARVVTREGMRAMANVNAAIKETVSGIAVAKNFRQESMIFEEFNCANQLSYQVNVKRGLVLSSVFPTLTALGGIGTAFLVYLGGLSVYTAAVTAGAWFLFLQSLDRFFFPVLNLSAFWAQVQTGMSAAERIFALIDAEPEVHQVGDEPVYSLSGEIEFINLCFRYSHNDPVLENFNLKILPGETIALVGHTGSGKSTIAKLIARFYEFQNGELLIDREDIRTYNLRSFRSHLGIVSQVPFLFSGTVAENICYACPEPELMSELEELAFRIGDGDWLESLPEGLNSQVGERGARLSMGQRQLVALMRVLIQQPAIFILDEATASVDPFTEWQIQQALELILADTTSILIAHRLSTVKSADRIIVLEDGRIIEEGTHDGLLAERGNYASLYNTYFRHQSLDYIEETRSLLDQ
jgi:ATP-binding cassette subfamily B protein